MGTSSARVVPNQYPIYPQFNKTPKIRADPILATMASNMATTKLIRLFPLPSNKALATGRIPAFTKEKIKIGK